MILNFVLSILRLSFHPTTLPSCFFLSRVVIIFVFFLRILSQNAQLHNYHFLYLDKTKNFRGKKLPQLEN